MVNIAATLDRAKVLHNLHSDYKLALVMGIGQNSLGNYRKGKTLPDERVLSKLCTLTGDDPALLTAQVYHQRAESEEARTIWAGIAERLKLTTKTAQAGFASIASMASILLVAGLLVLAQTFTQSHAQQGLQGGLVAQLVDNINCVRLKLTKFAKWFTVGLPRAIMSGFARIYHA